jgi:hypothetical protein
MWSIGNEIPGQNSPESGKTAAALAARVRELDPTRPVLDLAGRWKADCLDLRPDLLCILIGINDLGRV